MASARYPVRGTVAAEPGPIDLDWSATALLIIDMQRDFMRRRCRVIDNLASC
jgi:hypothetical protein